MLGRHRTSSRSGVNDGKEVGTAADSSLMSSLDNDNHGLNTVYTGAMAIMRCPYRLMAFIAQHLAGDGWGGPSEVRAHRLLTMTSTAIPSDHRPSCDGFGMARRGVRTARASAPSLLVLDHHSSSRPSFIKPFPSTSLTRPSLFHCPPSHQLYKGKTQGSALVHHHLTRASLSRPRRVSHTTHSSV